MSGKKMIFREINQAKHLFWKKSQPSGILKYLKKKKKLKKG